MITDEDYEELKKQMFKEFKENPEWQGTIGDTNRWWILENCTTLSKKLAKYLNNREIHAAMNSVTSEYCKVKFASIDLAEALSYILGWRPKDWDAEKARDLGRAALAKAGISLPEPMNQESYYYYVISNRHIESGWEYESDAIDRCTELQEAGVENTIVLKDNLIIDPWGNNNWRDAQ